MVPPTGISGTPLPKLRLVDPTAGFGHTVRSAAIF
jgi:hypothetical protein